VGGNVLRFCSVEIIESRLERDSLGKDFLSEVTKNIIELSLFGLRELGRRFSFLNDSLGVHVVHEDFVQLVTEDLVVDKADTSFASILLDETRDLDFSELNVEGTNACSELKKIQEIKCQNLPQPHHSDPF
jgi:hypothetical protein